MARTAGRSADETRQLILTSAARLIGRHGTTVPVTDIAEAAGVSKGGLLYHFPNKETLLNGVATNLMTQFRSHVEQAATAEVDAAKQAELQKERLAEQQMTIELTEAAKDLLAERGFDPVLGARPLRRLVQREIGDELAQLRVLVLPQPAHLGQQQPLALPLPVQQVA